MLPARILVLAQLPSTPSGKIDRQALLAHLECSNSLAPPSETQIEARIMQIWQSVLQFEQISLDDNFFEIGGDSLRLAQVYEALVKEFGFRAPKLTTLLQIPTIRAIAQYLTQPDTVLPTPVQKAKRDNLISQHRAARRSARK
jgi:acyl carrier protein